MSVLMVEKEDVIELGSHQIMVKPDAVLQHKETGVIHALEMKTHGYNKPDYFESWASDMQTLMHIWALERLYPDETIGSVFMEFLYKGYSKIIDGHRAYYSPLLRSYRKSGSPPF